MGETLSFAADGGTSDGYLARPAAKDARGVVVIQEWWGLNDHIKRVADRLAGEGFMALAPDLYHGKQTKSPDEAGKLMMALDIARAEQDLHGSVAHLTQLSGGSVGTVGFCMGGTLSLFAACVNGADVAACVVYYGGHMAVKNDFDRLQAPVQGHWAERDDWANANAKAIEAELQKRGKPYEFHRYPGTQHAFFNDARPEVYDDAAAKLSFARTLAFFRKHLQGA
jgi:carboxymethylenebutenolidase